MLGPPVLFLAVLEVLRVAVSPAFAPHASPFGLVFGVVAGLFEEVGWTGFAFPRLLAQRSTLAAAATLGVLWGLWHAPVADYLGAAAPHGAYWLPFFVAFVVLATALRVLICWVYVNTGSVLLAMLMHASNTGSLATLAPAQISPAQETVSYAVYAAVLWAVVAVLVLRYGTALLVSRPPVPRAAGP